MLGSGTSVSTPAIRIARSFTSDVPHSISPIAADTPGTTTEVTLGTTDAVSDMHTTTTEVTDRVCAHTTMSITAVETMDIMAAAITEITAVAIMVETTETAVTTAVILQAT